MNRSINFSVDLAPRVIPPAPAESKA